MVVKTSKAIVIALVLVLCASGLSAWEFTHRFGSNFAYYFDDHKGIETEGGGFVAPNYSPLSPDDNAAWLAGPFGTAGLNWTEADPETRKLGSGWGAVEIEAYYRFTAKSPFLQGSGMLTKDNNIVFDVKPIITPVSFHVENKVQWTPLAFLVVEAGLAAGTGWPLSFLNLHGLALNNADDITNTAVSGLVLIPHLRGTIQFDFAAIWPGEMNHFVVSLSAKSEYRFNSSAGPDDAWYWRADRGQNYNGWYYRGDYAVGWQPPWKVNFIGFVMEHRAALSPEIVGKSTIASGGWGSDHHRFIFGPAVNLDLSKGHSMTILLQMENGLYYTEDTVFARHFERWSATGESFVRLYRLALAYTWKMN